MAKNDTLEVFYDGGCGVCDREIGHYKKIGRDAGLSFIDISDPAFSPERYDKSREDFMRRLHVRDDDGRFHTGVDAFRRLWRRLPGIHYRLLAALVELPGIRWLAQIGYDLFARNRHLFAKDGK